MLPKQRKPLRLSWRSNVKRALLLAGWIVAAIGASYVLIAHRAHALEWLPFALLLACPLMHIFMHGRHGDRPHGHSGSPEG